LPRKVNRIAHYALTAAALENKHQVNEIHLQTALDELQP
jgi:general secretion pathway protein A